MARGTKRANMAPSATTASPSRTRRAMTTPSWVSTSSTTSSPTTARRAGISSTGSVGTGASSPSHAQSFALNTTMGGSHHPLKLPVVMRAQWKGAGEDPYRTNTAGDWPEEQRDHHAARGQDERRLGQDPPPDDQGLARGAAPAHRAPCPVIEAELAILEKERMNVPATNFVVLLERPGAPPAGECHP